MRKIKLRSEGNFKSKDVFLACLKTSRSGMDPDTMRKRVRVIKIINACDGDELVLKSIEYLTLKQVIEEPAFSVADEKLLEIIDDVLDADKIEDDKKEDE